MGDRRHTRPSAIPIVRISCLLIMLVIIGLTVRNLHQRAVAPGPAPDLAHAAAAPEKPLSMPSKNRPSFVEKNSDELKRFLHESEVIQDKSTSIRPSENRAYWRLLDWVESQPTDDLKNQPFSQVSFNDLVQHPSKHRGQLVRVELLVCKVSSQEFEDLRKRPRKLYELWGWPTDSGGWLYDVVTPELPPGFPMGDSVQATATVYGYFFKTQGYQPADAKPNARPLVAPLLIGRVTPVAVVAGPEPQNWLSILVVIIGGAIVIAAIVGWCIAANGRPGSRMASSVAWPDPMDEVDNE